ncbi:coiled-coil domain-containing protein 39-like [Arctopsyche grandis]|uniref:coiled-coil domain-containing protein 39-like n=1 Tax=Arctopsyche grandis TaxID=121162 RepID=UPI00406D895F
MAPYLNNILENLGWSDGMYIPVANEENKLLEQLLNSRNKELQHLKEEIERQKIKDEELSYHKRNIQNEHKKNMQLLAVYKEELDKEENHNKLMSSELSKISQDIANFKKQSSEIDDRSERVQADIAKVLKKIELLRASVGEERGSLDEWRAALQRSENDITTFNSFSKEDNALINDLEIKRQRLKMEYDKKHHNLIELCGNLDAEEKSAERVSEQVAEALTRRRHIVSTWSEAIENLRQRDKNIKHMKQELQMYRDYADSRVAYAQEKQDFLNMQKANSAEAEKELMEVKATLTNKRQELKRIREIVKALESELICTKRELVNSSNELSNCRIDNKKLAKEIQTKEKNIEELNNQVKKYKEKLTELMTGSKTAMQRLNQLEEMFTQIIVETERTQHRLLSAQRQLAALKNEEDSCLVDIRGYKSSVVHLEGVQSKIQKELLMQEENLYNVVSKRNYQLETALTRLGKLEGEPVDNVDYEMYKERAIHLKSVLEEKRATVQLLASQMTKLEGEHRLLIKNLSTRQKQYENLQDRLRGLMAETDGASAEQQVLQKSGRALRADLSGLQLQTTHTEQTVKKLCNKGDTVAKAHLDLNAAKFFTIQAVSERIVEAKERQAVILTHRRVLQEERGSLVASIKSEQTRLEQLKKRYEIYVSTLGEDENGEALSVAYFKVKNAQEKSELQQEGDNLDADIKKGEQEIAALEATLQVVDATNRKFIRSLDTVKEDDPEIIEYNSLCQAYNHAKDLRSQIISQVRFCSKRIEAARKEIQELEKRTDELHNARDDLIDEFKLIEKDLKEQTEKLNRANEYRKKTGTSARRKIKSTEIWNIHEKDIRSRELWEANCSAETQLKTINATLCTVWC